MTNNSIFRIETLLRVVLYFVREGGGAAFVCHCRQYHMEMYGFYLLMTKLNAFHCHSTECHDSDRIRMCVTLTDEPMNFSSPTQNQSSSRTQFDGCLLLHRVTHKLRTDYRWNRFTLHTCRYNHVRCHAMKNWLLLRSHFGRIVSCRIEPNIFILLFCDVWIMSVNYYEHSNYDTSEFL